jgi:NDP-sugar pyrophosphorylase family protein
MKAMVLAAGLGTRLRPLTDDRPKALVEIDGHTLLEIALRRLRSFGVTEAIVNTHHFAEIVKEFLRGHDFGMRVEISHEETLLDTGGGLKQAAWFFLEGDAQKPFLLHNVDVLSTIDLDAMVCFHREQNALATLAVQDRVTSRPLLFDERGELCGRKVGDVEPEMAKHANEVKTWAFAGIHVLSPAIFGKLSEEGAFPIIPAYLRMAAQGEKVVAFNADQWYWRDLGRPENVAAAETDLRNDTYLKS